jgi:hypothetical protein
MDEQLDKIDPLLLLDTVLECLNEGFQFLPCANAAQLCLSMSQKLMTSVIKNERDVELIVQQLIIDGYATNDIKLLDGIRVNNKPLSESFDSSFYFITFKGKVFLQKGGYLGQERRRVEEKKKILDQDARILLNEIHQKKSDANLNILTCIIALGTAIAAVYYLIQIWDCFCHCR